LNYIKLIYNRSILILLNFLYGYVKGSGVKVIGNIFISNFNVIGDFSSLISSENGSITLDGGSSIGKNAWIASGEGKINIGKECIFGPNVTIVAQNHGVKMINKESCLPWERDSKAENVSIGMRCHIGANVTILPGVKIGNYCTIGANSVVNKSFPDCSIIGGVPSKLISSVSIEKFNDNRQTKYPPYLHTSKIFL